MTFQGQVHCHLLWASGDAWDLEQSVFSLLAQEDIALEVSIHPLREGAAAAQECLERLAPLAPAVSLELAPDGAPLLRGNETAVAVWIAGTIATPEHFARCHAGLGKGSDAVVAPMRRMQLEHSPGGPPFVWRKSWTWTSPRPTLAEVRRDPVFLGRCLALASAAPPWLPRTVEEQQRWGGELWARTQATRIDGPPSIDLPDLRESGARTDLRDVLADLRYQLPRTLERQAPLTFRHLRRWAHRRRSSTDPGRD